MYLARKSASIQPRTGPDKFAPCFGICPDLTFVSISAADVSEVSLRGDVPVGADHASLLPVRFPVCREVEVDELEPDRLLGAFLGALRRHPGVLLRRLRRRLRLGGGTINLSRCFRFRQK